MSKPFIYFTSSFGKGKKSLLGRKVSENSSFFERKKKVVFIFRYQDKAGRSWRKLSMCKLCVKKTTFADEDQTTKKIIIIKRRKPQKKSLCKSVFYTKNIFIKIRSLIFSYQKKGQGWISCQITLCLVLTPSLFLSPFFPTAYCYHCNRIYEQVKRGTPANELKDRSRKS